MTAQVAEANRARSVNTMNNLWQERWVASEKGRRTAGWFPDVRVRLERDWFVPDHFVSQLLSGHGDFNHSLHRFNLRGDAICRVQGDPIGRDTGVISKISGTGTLPGRVSLRPRASGRPEEGGMSSPQIAWD